MQQCSLQSTPVAPAAQSRRAAAPARAHQLLFSRFPDRSAPGGMERKPPWHLFHSRAAPGGSGGGGGGADSRSCPLYPAAPGPGTPGTLRYAPPRRGALQSLQSPLPSLRGHGRGGGPLPFSSGYRCWHCRLVQRQSNKGFCVLLSLASRFPNSCGYSIQPPPCPSTPSLPQAIPRDFDLRCLDMKHTHARSLEASAVYPPGDE